VMRTGISVLLYRSERTWIGGEVFFSIVKNAHPDLNCECILLS